MGTSEPWTAGRQDQLAAFDRWLTAHDAEVARKAKTDGFTEGKAYQRQLVAETHRWNRTEGQHVPDEIYHVPDYNPYREEAAQ